jgi:hypothetical protein
VPASVRGIAFAAVVAIGVVWLTSDTALGRQGCVTGFSPTTLTIPPSGATPASPATFTVITSSSSCVWTYESTQVPGSPPFSGFPIWLGIPSQSGGTGTSTISFSVVLPNHDPVPRLLTLTYGGQSLTVTQAANPCPLTLSALSPMAMPANGGTGSFTVTTSGTSCSYVALPDAGVTFVSGGSGNTFPATVTFAVEPNTTQDPTTRRISVSSLGAGTGFLAPSVAIAQNGPPVATDAPVRGFVFAVHRPGSGSPHVSSPEPLRLTNAENPTASWTATSSVPWLAVSPPSGATPSTATISIDAAAAAVLARGTYSGTVRFASSIAPDSPRSLTIGLRITDGSSPTQAPIGILDIPIQGATGLSGAVPVGGWTVDDVGISGVLIFRNAVAGEPPGEIFLGDGTRIRGARPDVVAASHTFNPGVTSAGWGLMVLSNVLPNGGNGTFTLSAYADDVEGHRTLLGRKTVTFDNTGSPFPFGTIDHPDQGATISGIYNNQGWVLAQPGRSIPFDGSTIRLFLDGAEQPQVAGYGFARPDVAALFPFPAYMNSNGPAAQFTFDTTMLADGLHTIVWAVADDLGALQGIGSRYMNIQNGGASQVAASATLEARSAADVRAVPQATALLWERLGLAGTWALRFAGDATQEIRQNRGERVEVGLDTWWWSDGCGPYAGYLVTGDVAGPLPPGASIDGDEGVFRWLPPIEFAGAYEFAFIRQACGGREERIPLRVVLGAK